MLKRQSMNRVVVNINFRTTNIGMMFTRIIQESSSFKVTRYIKALTT